MYYKYPEYIGEIIEKLPFNIGEPLFKLNSVMSSYALDQYIYVNNSNQYFYIEGVYQYPNELCPNLDLSEYYHLALIIPISNLENLKSYLSGKIEKSDLYNPKGNCYLLKLEINTYMDNEKEKYTLYPVKNNQVLRGHECNVLDFELLEIKECLISNLPDLVNPFYLPPQKYYHREKLNFIFNSEEDRISIDNFLTEN